MSFKVLSKRKLSTFACAMRYKRVKCQELVSHINWRKREKLSSKSLTRKKRPATLFHEDYLDLMNAPTKLFHPYRLLIMRTLTLHGNVEFRDLRHNVPEITDGNLASHLGVLEKLKYVHFHKEIVNRKIRTSYEITEKGRKAFEQLTNSLHKFLEKR